ncbi:hypothetical protein AA0111_g11384 [Alternaria arborescens]|uniref:hypothetical protein n=1 Tax=Alternaria arborescens TaxID=156630 RepID=UPI00107521B3|nr:hypothetical protein AA0111_g11384 [Alternaria arborescens]RYO16542.1 hypothetical protein AA0111_g11384 [Alternaria arborescens]
MPLPTASRPNGSCTKIPDHTPLPVETPPSDAKRGICRLHFLESEEQDSLDFLKYRIAIQFERFTAVRSCPLCDTELVHYGMIARIEHLLAQACKAQGNVTALRKRYDYAYEPFERLEELEEDVAGVMEDFRNETNNSSQPTKDSLFTQLHKVLNKNKIWGRDLDYLEQLLLDGHSIPEAIQIWYTFKLDWAQEDFAAQSMMLGKQLDPLVDQLHELEYALQHLFADLHEFDGFLDLEIALEVQNVFGATALSDEVFEEPEEWSRWQDNTGLKIENAEIQSDWLHRTIGRFQRGLSSPEVSGRVEQEEDTADVYTAVTNAMEEGYDLAEVWGFADSEGVTDSDYGDEDAMDFDVLDSP